MVFFSLLPAGEAFWSVAVVVHVSINNGVFICEILLTELIGTDISVMAEVISCIASSVCLLFKDRMASQKYEQEY